MQPENIPLAALVYGQDVRIVSDPALLERVARALRGALAASSVLRYDELRIDTRTRVVKYGRVRVELRRREYALLAHLAGDQHVLEEGREPHGSHRPALYALQLRAPAHDARQPLLSHPAMAAGVADHVWTMAELAALPD